VNIKEYISSGIIESYVLGLASPEEATEFERMCAAHQEVRAARDAFELEMEKQAMDRAIAPPAHLKSKIFAEIEIESDSNDVQPVYRIPKPVVRAGWMKFLAAASLILLLASTLMNLYFFSQYKKYISKYDELLANQTQMASVNQTLQTKLQDYDSMINRIKDPAMIVVKLPGVPGSPNPTSLATVYWNNQSKDVYLLVNNLPLPVEGKQYQLWALVDGKPVDAGVFEMGSGSGLVRMKNIPQAQAFAITLEKKGGSDKPDLSSLYVLGKVTS
jgi:anti-sigma-K factor RskA